MSSFSVLSTYSPQPPKPSLRRLPHSESGQEPSWKLTDIASRITISFSWISQSFTCALFHKESPYATTVDDDDAMKRSSVDA
ncbi:hypothetical protein HanIR_Chr14g0696051 [Helianthus annuus]|nr:hypothetical protein HanIR_Chr14g0696051 [Helianthus annuus]